MKKISTRFPEELLDEVDTLAELACSDRTTILKQALREYLDKKLANGKFKELVVRRFSRVASIIASFGSFWGLKRLRL